MTSKKGLGKGLDSLITDKSEKLQSMKDANEKNVSRETLVNINEIEPNRTQPRKSFDEDSLQELAESIKQHGIIQPLIVQKRNKTYEIIAGERRWRASRLAGLKQIPVIVKDYSDQQILEIAIIENIQREDLNAVEEAFAYQRLIEEYQLKQDEVAERVGKSRVAVTNSLRLLKLDKRVQQMLIDDLISGGHARALLSVKNEDDQYTLANQVFDEKLSVRETEKLVKKFLEPKSTETKLDSKEDELVYRQIEEKMKAILGSKVSIHRRNNNKGKIEIEYYSMNDLERLIDLVKSIEA